MRTRAATEGRPYATAAHWFFVYGRPSVHRCPVKDESCPRFFGYEICGWALLPLGEGGPRAKRKGRMRGQFQLSKRAPHPPLRGTFSPWEKGQPRPS